MRLRMVIFATLAVFAGAAPALSQIPPEIPKSVVALASGQSFAATKRISLTVSSRRPENQATPEDLEDFRRRSLKTLPKTPFTLVPDKSTADFDLELIFEPYVRYGMFHYQNAPYLYLTLREAKNGRLVYCSYQRLEHLHSASKILLRRLKSLTHQQTPSAEGSLPDCAAQAMRPMYYSTPTS
jgi:hypothetical protein